MAGRIQNQDLKTAAELIAAGASAADLPNDSKIYVTANSINKTLLDAIEDGDIGSGVNFGRTTFAGIIPHAAAFGTVANEFYYYWRIDNQVFIEGQFQAGTLAANLAYIDLSGIAIDSALMFGGFTAWVGDVQVLEQSTTTTQARRYVAYYDGTDTDRIYFTLETSSGNYLAYNASALAANSSYWQFKLSFPVVGW